MSNWHEARVKYIKNAEDGTLKKVTETYLVDALSIPEANKRVTDEVAPYVVSDFEVTGVKQVKIAELFEDNNSMKWFKAKVNMITLDEDSGEEKRTPVSIIVEAPTFKESLANLETGMKGTLSDWEVADIVTTKIVDIFK